ncbi:MAG: HD domain-containing protein [Bacteroidota bacterium]
MLTQTQQNMIAQTIAFVKSGSAGESTGHDWWHIYRVEKLALYLAEKEKAELFLVRLAALLHDVDDWKFNAIGSAHAENWLKSLDVDAETIEKVVHIIAQVSYKGAGEDTMPDSIEARVVQDADRLDALGAIGIARAFAYGGSKNREIYDPEVLPVMHADFEAYKTKVSHTINHFYEKLLLLKDRLHTSAARELAEKRHAFMEEFLKNFFEEWNFEEDGRRKIEDRSRK